MLAACCALSCLLAAQDPGPALTHGPFRGHAGPTEIAIWARAARPGRYELHLRDAAGGDATVWSADARREHDCTLHWRAHGLRPGTAHELRITCGGATVHAAAAAVTTSLPDDAGHATIAFGSCANDRTHPEQAIWGQILARAPHALVLLGDTPYIDDGTVEGRRRRHREFYALPPVRAALAAIPTYATWDDHDYATNDAFGAIAGTESARPVFAEYHALPSLGDGRRGVYTRFRRGPVEVFLLDTRSFAGDGESPLAAGQATLLGAAQVAWLQEGLRASTAAFRVLACGMVWNGAVRPGKPDCWERWRAERDGLLAWIGAQRIAGVVLVAGDVHRSRVIVHSVAALAGYAVPELVTSPLAANVIEANAVATPGLVFDAGEPESCLLLTASAHQDDAELCARFVAGDGRELFVLSFRRSELTARTAAGGNR
jgi:alkaline phosphatase D